MNKVPELRFAGFAGEWEEHIFGEIIERKSKNSNKDSIPRVEYEDIIPGIGKLNKDISLKTSNKKGLYFKSDDVLYGKLRPYLKNYLHPQFEGIAVGDFWVLNNKSGVNSFLFYHLQTSKFQSIANTSIGTKMPRSDWNLVSDSRFNHPSIDEQEKIGDLLKKIDGLIEIQEGKVSKMEDFKKSMLQKMFPKKDELVPEFRFVGFDEEWKELSIGDKYKVTMGQSPKSENYTSDTNLMVLVQGNADLENGRVTPRIYTKEVTKTSIKGDILMTVRAPVGTLAINEYDVVIGRGVCSIKANTFIYYSLINMNLNNYWNRFSSGSTFESINSSDIKTARLKIPSITEQKKIGQFFKNLDSQIETEKKLLDSYKMMKKSLLQKLFV